MKKTRGKKPVELAHLELDVAAVEAIIERGATGALSPQEQSALRSMLKTLVLVKRELERSTASLARLRSFVFSGSEKTRKVLDDTLAGETATTTTATATNESASTTTTATTTNESSTKPTKPKARGHGRNGADAYPGATRVTVPHATLKDGDRCPECKRGNVNPCRSAGSHVVRLKAQAPVSARIYDCEGWRCNACQTVFAAEPPAEAGNHKYDETVPALLAIERYALGAPFKRIAQLQHWQGVPLPVSTQWDLVEEAAVQLGRLFDELRRQAATGAVVHTDDTPNKVLRLTRAERDQELGEKRDDRTGVRTTGIISTREGRPQIVLYETGPRHAGENLDRLLELRPPELPRPIVMCDASSSNTSGEFEMILANCIPHGRRKFVEVVDHFPAECARVLQGFRDVYVYEAIAREYALNGEERLELHQRQSGPVLAELKKWIEEQFSASKVEPNSSLGQALQYLRNHWPALTLFLHVAGAPLDNNICERALKKAIRHRNNSLFFKTLNGAYVGDLFMSLIQTCIHNEVDPFRYLVGVLRNRERARKRPAEWMPWNFHETLALLTAADASSRGKRAA